MALAVLLSLSAVCASDVNQTDNTVTTNQETTVDTDYESTLTADNESTLTVDNDGADDVLSVSKEKIKTSYKSSAGTVFIKDTNYDFKLLDGNGTPISHKKVHVTFNGVTSDYTTTQNGHVYVNLTAVGACTLGFLFDESGYEPLSVSKKLTVVKDSKSTIEGSDYVAYQGVKNKFIVQLKTGGIKMADKRVVFNINGQKYVKYTNAKGIATLTIKMATGKYKVKYGFGGEKNADAAYGAARLTVIKGMPTKLILKSETVFMEKTKHKLQFKFVDARGNAMAGKPITFKIGGVAYTKKTTNYGNVHFTVKRNKGVYQAIVTSYGSSVYNKATNSYSLVVTSSHPINGGFWLFGADMKDVNLKYMARNGVNNIFLNEYAVTLHGKSGVADFANQAGKYGIKVHIWMMTFYDGDWISPVTSSGEYKYSLFKSLIKDAKYYASIKGVDGIHFDYIRFPGDAYNHKNGVSAISYFTKLAAEELHNNYRGIIVSAAVMPEPNGMKYYYGQDIPYMSRYLDIIIPMVYKGNYESSSAWIRSTTAAFVRMSEGAEIWTGLQGYYSDSYVKKLPQADIITDAVNAVSGGAKGVIVFRYTLFSMFNFNSL